MQRRGAMHKPQKPISQKPLAFKLQDIQNVKGSQTDGLDSGESEFIREYIFFNNTSQGAKKNTPKIKNKPIINLRVNYYIIILNYECSKRAKKIAKIKS